MTQTFLYNGAQGGTPDSQGWLDFGATLLGGTQTASSGLTNLDTGLVGLAGYSNYEQATPTLVNSIFPTLNRTISFSFSFDIKINSESHLLSDRAGFSVIAMASDKKGIELGFWNNEIWAQETGLLGGTLFTHDSQERAFGSTTSLTHYDLVFVGKRYLLLADYQPILVGAIRDYSAFDNTGILPFDPYETSNFLFLGDNTTSAESDVDLTAAAVNTGTGGTTGGNTLSGDVNDDILTGRPGNDTLIGGDGYDVLRGGRGNDVLTGGAKNDVLIGGLGSDTLMGSGGSDYFFYARTNTGVDTITDFQVGADQLWVSASGFGGSLTSGATLTADQFKLGAAATDSSDRFIHNSGTGALLFDADGNGSGAAVQIAKLSAGLGLTQANIFVFV